MDRFVQKWKADAKHQSNTTAKTSHTASGTGTGSGGSRYQKLDLTLVSDGESDSVADGEADPVRPPASPVATEFGPVLPPEPAKRPPRLVYRRLWENEYHHNTFVRSLARATRAHYTRRAFQSFQPIPFEHSDLRRPHESGVGVTCIEFDRFGALCAVGSANGSVAVHDIECALTHSLVSSADTAAYDRYVRSEQQTAWRQQHPTATESADGADCDWCAACNLPRSICDCPPAEPTYRLRPGM